MPLGTIRGTVSGGAGAALLSSAEAAGRGESRGCAAGGSWDLAAHAHARAKNRKQTPRESAIVGTPIPLYSQQDAAPEGSVACRRASGNFRSATGRNSREGAQFNAIAGSIFTKRLRSAEGPKCFCPNRY